MKRLRHLLKGAISLALLWYVFAAVGWREILDQLAGVRADLLVVFLLLGALQVGVSAWKWRILAGERRLRFSLGTAVVLYFKGIFFSQLLPTSVGGDVVRGYELGRQQGRMADAMASVFMERFTGLVMLMVYAAVAIPLNPVLMEHPGVKSVLSVTLAGFFLGSWLVLDSRGRHWLEPKLRIGAARKLFEKAGRLQDAISAYRHHRLALALAFAASALFYGLGVLNLWVGALAFGVHVPLLVLATAAPLLLLLFLVPISIGGLGLNEWAFTQVLALVGMAPAVGLAVGVLHRGRSVLFGLVGGTFYPLDAARAAAAQARRVATPESRGAPPPARPLDAIAPSVGPTAEP